MYLIQKWPRVKCYYLGLYRTHIEFSFVSFSHFVSIHSFILWWLIDYFWNVMNSFYFVSFHLLLSDDSLSVSLCVCFCLLGNAGSRMAQCVIGVGNAATWNPPSVPVAVPPQTGPQIVLCCSMILFFSFALFNLIISVLFLFCRIHVWSHDPHSSYSHNPNNSFSTFQFGLCSQVRFLFHFLHS